MVAIFWHITENYIIYNYLELRKYLQSKGVKFRTKTDTEVVLNALIYWGEQAFKQFNGMWALVFVDTISSRIILSRDRFGEKPLYYYNNSRGLYIASEIKAICAATQERFSVNPVVAARFLGQMLLEAQNETFFQGVSKVPAGHYQVISLQNGLLTFSEPESYWECPCWNHTMRDTQELLVSIRDKFFDAIRLRLRSDVPIGVLLSGGVDSSAIAAAVHKLDANITYISAVSDDPVSSEEYFVDIMARYLKHEVVKVQLQSDPEYNFNLLRRAIWANDEPISGFSAAAHMELMARARERGITVVLSGQGADELLCGYQKYYVFYLQHLFKKGGFRKSYS